MIWILLAALGVPLWLIVGALTAGLLARRAFKRGLGVFPAKLRVVAGASSVSGRRGHGCRSTPAGCTRCWSCTKASRWCAAEPCRSPA